MVRGLYISGRSDSGERRHFFLSLEVELIDFKDINSVSDYAFEVVFVENSAFDIPELAREIVKFSKYFPVVVDLYFTQDLKIDLPSAGLIYPRMGSDTVAAIIKHSVFTFKNNKTLHRISHLTELLSALKQFVQQEEDVKTLSKFCIDYLIDNEVYTRCEIILKNFFGAVDFSYSGTQKFDKGKGDLVIHFAKLLSDTENAKNEIVLSITKREQNFGYLRFCSAGNTLTDEIEMNLVNNITFLMAEFMSDALKADNDLVQLTLQQQTKSLIHAQRLGNLGSWVLNLTTGEITGSEKAYEIVDFRGENGLFFRDIRHLICESDLGRFDSLFEKILSDKKEQEAQFCLNTFGGVEKYILIRAEFSEYKGFNELTGIIQDITETRKARLAVMESEEKFRTFFELGLIGMCILDLDLSWINVNNKFCEMLGYSKEELENIHWDAITHPKHSREEMIGIEKIRTGISNSFFGEKRFISKSNKILDTRISIKSVCKDGIKPDYFLCLVEDISEKVEYQQSLEEYKDKLEEMVLFRTKQAKESEERFRTLAENSEDSIMRFNLNFEHLYVNRVVEMQTGIKQHDFIGKTHEQLGFDKHIIEVIDKALSNAVLSKRKNRIEFMLPNGLWIDWLIIPEFDENGEVKSLMTSGRDITERKRVEEKLNRALELERQTSEMKSQFISTTSHEFRTPLTTILASAELIEMYSHKWSDEKLREHYNKIYTAVDYMTSLLDDVLTINHSDSGKLLFTAIKGNLDDFCKGVFEDARNMSGLNHILEYTFAGENVVHEYDPKLLRQILSNLLSNAIKYSPHGGLIELRIKPAKNGTEFMVSDQGMGISDKDINKVFDAFHRGGNSTAIAGTGLGLTIVKQLVELMNGKLRVISAPGEGSRFFVTLPI